MIEYLEIKDFILIDHLVVDFSSGLNVLTGETGAGKSVFIGALSFLLGAKTDLSCIRTGCRETSITGSVLLGRSATNARRWLDDHGIQPEGDVIILRRILRDNGRTGAWIGGTSVTRAELEEFTGMLFDMHGQHEHQSLLKTTEHRRFLDDFAGIADETFAFTALYTELAEKKKQFQEFISAEQDKNRKMELLSFSVQEITEAKLVPNEDAELDQEESRLSQFEKICSSLDQLLVLLSGTDESLLSALKHGKQLLDMASAADKSLDTLQQRFESGYYEFDDIAESLRRYRDSLLFDPARLEEIEERLSMIFKLKKKYGASIPEIIEYGESCAKQLALLQDFDSSKESLKGVITQLEKNLLVAGAQLTKKRTDAAAKLEQQIMTVLADLGMKGTVFSIRIQNKNSSSQPVCGPYGFDDIEFLISPNRGEPLRPLAKIASGGEISRVMLAVKSILAAVDETETLIFDEIDTGIGGEIALAVGAYLKKLAGQKQLICITHQASIAARADNHIKIKKTADNNSTRTEAVVISGNVRTEEIARMLAGDAFGETALLHAGQLLKTYGGSVS